MTCVATHQFGGDERADHVTAVALFGQTLFVGTKKRLEALIYDPKEKKFAPDTESKVQGGSGTGFEVTNIRKEPKQLLVSTMDGYTLYDGKSWSSESVGPINDLLTYEDRLWIARNRGLEDKVGQDWKEQKIPSIKLNPTRSSRIRSLAVGPDGVLWMGSEFGIYSFTAKEKRWGGQLYGDYQNILNDIITNEKGNSQLCFGNLVNRIDVDAENQKLLICTETGLSIFDGKDQWKTVQGDYEILSSEEGRKTRVKKKGNVELPSPNVTVAAYIGGILWLGTPGGLVRVEGDKTECFDTGNGFPASAITSLAHDPASNSLFVGTEKGLAVLSPVSAAS
ncbi:MAG: hypothetical protein HY815_33350, partial [Candidatus Riflebacteria bacterium]|nr:hypothetical protein [Candidatus Riflebacteria bacterium]